MTTATKKPKLLNIPGVGGAWVSLGHKQLPPEVPARLFGPPRFTPEQQAEHPDKPMTRLVKDVIRVGKWKISHDAAGNPVMWDCTPDYLTGLCRNFALATKNGCAFNLTLSHGEDASLHVPTDELLTPIDDVVFDGNTFWCAVYVTPEQAKALKNPAMKVSIGALPEWEDGEGRTYPGDTLVHVAVTDHPAVTGQGPFLELANKVSRKGQKTMDFAALTEILNKLLAMVSPNAVLPEDTSEENVVERMGLILSIIGGDSVDTADTTADAGTGDVMDGGTADGSPLSQSQDKSFNNLQKAVALALKPFQDEIKTLSNTVAELKTDKANTAKKAFLDRCAILLKNGIPAASIEQAKKLGASQNYDPAILQLVEQTSGRLSTISRAKSLANASGQTALSSDDEPGRRSDEEVRKSLEARGIDPKHMPSSRPMSVNGRG